MNKQLGDQYEEYIVDHLKNTGEFDNVWLWREVPERILFEENIITDYAIYSLVRNDIGIDILASKGDDYTYIQCKNYTGTICVLDLAGYFFFKAAYGKKCKVYYSGNLSNRIKLIYPNSDEFVNVSYVNQYCAPANINTGSNDIVYETREYQQEAVRLLKDKKRAIISLPCGMGKTYLSCLMSEGHNNIIFFAPTKELSSQTYDIYANYFKDYTCNLVSGDGTRVLDRYNLSDKNIFISTYKSCDIINVLIKKLKDPYIIIDEFHNLSSNDILDKKNHLYKILHSKHQILYLSATPTYLNYTDIFGTDIYKYNCNDAIKNKYINDFEIVLPTNEYTTINFEDFLELFKIEKKEDFGDLSRCKYIRKMYFLVRNMLYNGNKKCIIYMPTSDKATECINIISWMKGLFNINICTSLVDCNTSKKDRQEFINKFITDVDISLLFNVHVLTEGINIPECDSVYIANPSDNLGNIVQRMSRCNRVLKGKNRSTVYIWCDEGKMDKIVNYINDCTGNELANRIAKIRDYTDKKIANSIKIISNIQNIGGTKLVNKLEQKKYSVTETYDTILKNMGFEDNIDTEIKKKIVDRINMLRIPNKKIDSEFRDILQSDEKFSDFVNLNLFLDETKYKKYYMEERKLKKINKRISKFKEIVTILGIKDGIGFDHDIDSAKFSKKISDKKLLDGIENIKKLFDIRGVKYKDFDVAGGYGRLYRMTIGICRQLFGGEIISSIYFCYRDKDEKKLKNIVKHNINIDYLTNIKKYIA